MNPPLLYRSRGRWMFWIAFVCAVGIHLGAVVVAKTKSENTRVESFTPFEGDVEFIETEPDPIPPEDSVTAPPLEQIRPEQEFFSEENLKEPTVRPHKKVRLTSIVRGATVSLRSAKAMATYAPRPVYPYQALRSRITGSGTALLTVDPVSGNVTEVFMLQSCGNAILDIATLDALRRWRFKPGTIVRVRVPITYTFMGVSY
jgi:TonB family protein